MTMAREITGVARVALLIDGENVASAQAGFILERAAALGQVDVRRVYGCAERMTQWSADTGLARVCTATGKNSADMRLCVDAMDLFLRAGYRAFVIASSDGDFTHLATYLREAGCHVEGIGRADASENFRAACHRFTAYLETPSEAGRLVGEAILTRTERRVVALLRQVGRPGLTAEEIGNRMKASHGTEGHSFGGWANYLATRRQLFVRDGNGRVSLRLV